MKRVGNLILVAGVTLGFLCSAFAQSVARQDELKNAEMQLARLRSQFPEEVAKIEKLKAEFEVSKKNSASKLDDTIHALIGVLPTGFPALTDNMIEGPQQEYGARVLNFLQKLAATNHRDITEFARYKKPRDLIKNISKEEADTHHFDSVLRKAYPCMTDRTHQVVYFINIDPFITRYGGETALNDILYEYLDTVAGLETHRWEKYSESAGRIERQYREALSARENILRVSFQAPAELAEIADSMDKLAALISSIKMEAIVATQREETLRQMDADNARSHSNVVASPAAQYARRDNPKSSGSGTIVTASGYILTAAHVVADATRVKVVTADGEKYASVVRIDESNDLAVIKITNGNYSAVPVSSSRGIRLGQAVSTIGFPHIDIQGFSPKVTRGEISSLNGGRDDPRSWQISVPVQSGNSGGPLLKWTPKVGQRGTVSINQIGTVQHVQETTSA